MTTIKKVLEEWDKLHGRWQLPKANNCFGVRKERHLKKVEQSMEVEDFFGTIQWLQNQNERNTFLGKLFFHKL